MTLRAETQTNPGWSGYAAVHGDRVNLVVHLATVPLFLAGTALAVATPVVGWIGLLGPAAMVVAIGLQGGTHRREATRPAPFLGPVDFARRIFIEQWWLFPRFVLSGELARTWRARALRG